MSDEKKTNSTEEEQEPIEQLPIKEEFELREKRLKLVYKILYVAAALWGIVFLAYVSEFSSNPEQLLKTAPLYCFLHALSSVVVLSIVSYAFRELQCMKISQKSTEFEKGTRRHHLCKYLEYLWHRGFHLGCFDDRPSLPSCYSGKCLYYRGCSIFFNHLKVSRGIPCEVCKS